MSGASRRLGRLLAIRRLSEDLDRRNLQLTLASVAEVEVALARQSTVLAESRLTARAALTTGNRNDWLMADAQGEVAGWNRGRLGTLLQARMVAVAPAMEKFLGSRREHEQVKHLVEDAQKAARSEDDHRAQAAADDWFLGKRTRNDD
ncbi:MAG TPA: hypothetical protein VF865_06745 [Acidobacteriaceae bacterium]